MHLFDDLFPSGDLVGVETAWYVGVSAGERIDERGFGDKQSPGLRSALAVVFDGKVLVNVVLVGAETSQGSHCETVLEVQTSDADRLEEGGGGHFGGF